MIKRSMIRVARTRLFSQLVSMLEKLERQANLLRVLTYHRVDDPEARRNLDPSLISATPEDFSRQMEHLAEHYHVVTVAEVMEAVRGHSPLPPRSVLITFDDAYQDFAEHAWPVLKRLGLPAVMFVPTAFPDRPRRFWWDAVYESVQTCANLEALTDVGLQILPQEDRRQTYRRVLRALKMLPHEELLTRVDELTRHCHLPNAVSPVMTWDQLRQLADQGLTLGAHTQTHPLLNRLPVAAALEEAITSLRELRSRVPGAPPVLAYPGGAFSADVVAGLKGHFDLAFTTCRGINDLATADPLRLRRINVGRNTPNSLVRAQLLGGIRHLHSQWPLESAV